MLASSQGLLVQSALDYFKGRAEQDFVESEEEGKEREPSKRRGRRVPSRWRGRRVPSRWRGRRVPSGWSVARLMFEMITRHQLFQVPGFSSEHEATEILGLHTEMVG